MSSTVRIALLLKPDYRTPGGIARVRLIATTVGIDVTGVSEAIVSGTLSAQLCQVLFGTTQSGDRPIVAEPLRALVESVAVMPAAKPPSER